MWSESITAEGGGCLFLSLCSSILHYTTAKEYRIRTDLSDKQGKDLRWHKEGEIASLIAQMPMTKWSASSKGLIAYEDYLFTIQIEAAEEHRKTLFQWTAEVCDYRLHMYFERKGQKFN